MTDVRVLIVDDHPTFRAGLRAILDGRHGIVVVDEADDGESAVAAAARCAPDVVVMDLAMPGLDGVAATRRIAGGPDSVKVLVLTMNDTDQALHAVLRAGARGYVLKDASADEIRSAVLAVAEGRAIFGTGVSERLLRSFAGQGPGQALPYPELTPREREVLHLVADGLDNTVIATRLHLSAKTVRNYVSALLDKLGAASRAAVVAKAREAGFGGPARSDRYFRP
ncbi:response regulator transcription factor [Planotetraspora kaengkrachanensis]|uniref:DNA-binding response regulator n=1 Tax=Planotetraspora kaengkrachanensis TaxID=575193 RepID=A0A8J3PZ16_9ACTN|nr:response regulator transcription factor [Planotetraspora kaengkrachanensis]GIG83709.1 DNA-binding response regulator [Planotetraspora kaengkrachanensis]